MAKYFDMTKVNTFTVAAPFSDMRVKACSIIGEIFENSI